MYIGLILKTRNIRKFKKILCENQKMFFLRKQDQAIFRRMRMKNSDIPSSLKKVIYFFAILAAVLNPLIFPIWSYIFAGAKIFYELFVGEMLAAFTDVLAIGVIIGYFVYLSKHEVGRVKKTDWQRFSY